MSLLFKEKPIVINADLAKAIGLNEAIVLQQLNYWITETSSGIAHDGYRWVYNTYEEWQSQFPFWSPETIKRTLTSLKKAGLIMVEQLNKHKHDRTNYYAINYSAINELDTPDRQDQNDLLEEVNMTPSKGSICSDLTEITTETNSETKTLGDKSPAKPVKQRTAKRKTQMPEGFQPSETHISKAKQHSISLTHEFEQFCNYHLSKGSTFADWDRALHTWLGNAVKFSRGGKSGRPAMKTSFENADYTGYDEAAPDWLGGGQ